MTQAHTWRRLINQLYQDSGVVDVFVEYKFIKKSKRWTNCLKFTSKRMASRDEPSRSYEPAANSNTQAAIDDDICGGVDIDDKIGLNPDNRSSTSGNSSSSRSIIFAVRQLFFCSSRQQRCAEWVFSRFDSRQGTSCGFLLVDHKFGEVQISQKIEINEDQRTRPIPVMDANDETQRFKRTAEQELRTGPNPIAVQLEFLTNGTAVSIEIDRGQTLSEIRPLLKRHLRQFADDQFRFLLLDRDEISSDDEQSTNVQSNIVVVHRWNKSFSSLCIKTDFEEFGVAFAFIDRPYSYEKNSSLHHDGHDREEWEELLDVCLLSYWWAISVLLVDLERSKAPSVFSILRLLSRWIEQWSSHIVTFA